MNANLPSKVRSLLQPDIQSTDLILTELPIQLPKEGSNEHLIHVKATAPCNGELLWAKNFPSVIPNDHDFVPCFDLSGIVAAAPDGSRFPAGTEIYTRTSAARSGNAREYSIAMTSELAVKPKNLSWEDAASVPLSAFTAYQALFVHGGITPPWKDPKAKKENAEKRLLITASAGAVGIWVVQLAKAAGVRDIIGIAGPDNLDFVKELGATETINYREQSLGEWAKQNEKVDLVVDMLGKKMLEQAWGAVKDKGTLLSIRELPETYRPKENAPDIAAKFFIMDPDGWQLNEVRELLEAGEVKPVVDSVWNLDQFKEAFEKVEGGRTRGKVILKV